MGLHSIVINTLLTLCYKHYTLTGLDNSLDILRKQPKTFVENTCPLLETSLDWKRPEKNQHQQIWHRYHSDKGDPCTWDMYHHTHLINDINNINFMYCAKLTQKYNQNGCLKARWPNIRKFRLTNYIRQYMFTKMWIFL